jgi:hypothetical protein
MNRNRFTASWRNNDPVTEVSPNGHIRRQGMARVWTVRGTGKRCVKVQPIGPKVREDWVWPEGWVWGHGKYRSACFECEQPFMTDAAEVARAEFCPPCERREAAAHRAAGTAIRDHRAYAIGSREKKADNRPHSEGELAAIAAQKEADEKESLF